MTKIKWFLLAMILIIGLTILIIQKEVRKTFNLDNNSEAVLVDPNSYIITVDKSDTTIGNPGAGNMAIEYLNFGNCNALCQSNHQKLYDFVKANPTQISLVFKHAGNNSLFSSSNKLAHMAVVCAGEQNKLWDFVNALVKDKKRNEKSFSTIAYNLKMDAKQFNTCINNQATIDKVNTEFSKAQLLPIDDNPTIFINNKKINVYKDVDLTELLTKATAATTN